MPAEAELKPRCSDSKEPLIQPLNFPTQPPVVGSGGKVTKGNDTMGSCRLDIFTKVHSSVLHYVFEPTLDSHIFPLFFSSPCSLPPSRLSHYHLHPGV